MTTLAEHIIVAGAKNRPSMLEKSMYDSWASCIRLFIKGKKHGRMMLDSIDNGPLVYPTVEENRQTRPMKYSKLTEAQQLQDECDGETLYEYYWRFSQLINDMHTIGMTMQQVQFYAYLSQHERHANEVRITRERYLNPLALVANSPTLYNPSQSPQHLGEDLIECINKAMEFLYVVASRFPPSNNQLRTSSNPKNQATIQDGKVTIQQVQGRQSWSFAGTRNRGIATPLKGNYAASQPREAGQILDEEQLAFLADPGISDAPVAQQTILQNLAFQTRDLDAYDLDCDDLSSAKAVLMANLSSFDSDVLYEVPYSDSSPTDMINQDVQEMQYSEQTHFDDFQDNEIHSDSNIILYSQYLQESQDAVIQDTNSSAPNDLLVLSLVEQMTDNVAYLDKEN
ncbi:hypothetical protein Tco_0555957 [Tanacetum coccineum]